jgi:hypothetical protein
LLRFFPRDLNRAKNFMEQGAKPSRKIDICQSDGVQDFR